MAEIHQTCLGDTMFSITTLKHNNIEDDTQQNELEAVCYFSEGHLYWF